jgi:putative copper resistance protein D
LSYLGKLGLLLAAMPFHAFFGILLMRWPTVIGGGFYRSLALPFVPDLLADQRVAAVISWAFGEISMVLVLVVLLVQWVGYSDTREPAGSTAQMQVVTPSWPATMRCSPNWQSAVQLAR